MALVFTFQRHQGCHTAAQMERYGNDEGGNKRRHRHLEGSKDFCRNDSQISQVMHQTSTVIFWGNICMFLHTWKVSLGFRALVSFERHTVEEQNPVRVVAVNFYQFLLSLQHLVFEPQLVKWILSINGELLTPTLYTCIFAIEVNVVLQELHLIILFASRCLRQDNQPICHRSIYVQKKGLLNSHPSLLPCSKGLSGNADTYSLAQASEL